MSGMMSIKYKGMMRPIHMVVAMKKAEEAKKAAKVEKVEVTHEVEINVELEKARSEYEEEFGKKPSSLMKLETIQQKMAEANEA